MKTAKINDKFLPLYTTKKRYILLSGGRGSLKSTSVHDFVARLTYEKGHGILFLRYTMTSAEKSIIPEFESCLSDRLEVKEHFHTSGNKITNLQTGSFVLFSGIKTSSGNQTANLKSLAGITTVIIEEGEDFVDEKAFDKIDDSVRTVMAQNRIIWIMNPTTKDHFIYKRWIKDTHVNKRFYGYDVQMSTHPNVEHIHTTYHIAKDLGYLDQSFIDKIADSKAKADKLTSKVDKYKSHYYTNYLGGWRTIAEGAIFDNWSFGEFDKILPYCYGQDYGFYPDPTTLVKVAVDQKKKIIYLHECFHNSNKLTTPEIIALNKAHIERPNDLIIADSAEPRLIAEIAQSNLNIQKAYKPQGSVLFGITKMLEYEIIITPTSINLETELSNYIWNDKKAGVPIDKQNHILDSSRYAFTRLTSGSQSQSMVGMDNLY